MKKWLAWWTICLLTATVTLAGENWGLEGDLNGDGVVNFTDLAILSRDWLQSDYTIEEDLLNNATLTRDSIAFLDGKQYAPNAPRKKLIAVCGVSDLQIHDEENVTGVGPVTLAPKCTAGGYIYATETNHSNIYRSLDGTAWERTTGSLTGAYRIFETRTGAILVARGDGTNMQIYRSTVGGSDLTDGSLPPSSLTLPSSGSNQVSLALWNFHQAQNGTICLGEYGNTGWPGFSRSRIYRSADDGVSFTQVYDDPDNVKHSHRVMKHEATGRWVNVYGDGAEINKLVKSDDDGITWTTLDPQIDNNFQPVELYDYGHSTNLLYGSDETGFIGTFDVLTRKITPLYDDGDRALPYVFAIYYHDGVFYAATYSNYSDRSKRRAAVLVSSDLVHWAVYHQFRNGELGVNRFLGFFGGKIHGILTLSDDSTWRHITFTPTTVQMVNGWCLDPPTNNMLDTAQYSSVETDTSGWSASIGTRTRITTDAVHGSACLRVEGNSGVETVYPRSRAVTVGKTYNGRIWLKANGQNLSGYARWYVYGSSQYGSNNFFCLSQDEWTEIVPEPVTIAAGGTHISIFVRPRSEKYPGPYDILVDGAQYEEGPPTRWQLGGAPRANEILSKTADFPERWTNLLLWAPECRSEWYARSGNQHIKSWCKDANNYVELYFDPCDTTFALQATVAGESRTPIKTSAYSFYRNGVIRFVVRCDEDSLRLSVAVAGPFEHVSGSAVDFLGSATLTSKTGDHNGTGVMSCTILADILYDSVIYIE